MGESNNPRARGPYAKSEGRRAEIIARATEAFSANGFHGASLREISSAVGLTQPGLIHHFGTKDALLAAVLERKDEADVATAAAIDADHVLDALRSLVNHNLKQPGLIRLYTTLSAESINPSHPAHDYFSARYDKAREIFSGSVRRAQAANQISSDLDPEALGVLLVAVMDGLQLQWLHDRKVDVEEAFARFLDLLRPQKQTPPARPRRAATKATPTAAKRSAPRPRR